MGSKPEELEQLSMGDLVDLCKEKSYEVTVKGNPLEFLSREALLEKLCPKPKTKKQ